MNTSSGARILSIGKESLLDIAEALLGSLDGLFVALILSFRRDLLTRWLLPLRSAAPIETVARQTVYNKFGNIFVGISDEILESASQTG